jgi:hypothetical protein
MFSEKFNELLLESSKNFLNTFVQPDPSYKFLPEASAWYSTHVTPFDSYFASVFSFNDTAEGFKTLR